MVGGSPFRPFGLPGSGLWQDAGHFLTLFFRLIGCWYLSMR